MASEIEQVELPKEVSKKGKKAPPKDKAQEELGDVAARLAKVEMIIAEGEKKLEEMDSNIEDLHDEMQGALNMVMDSCSKQVKERCDPLTDKLAVLEFENKALKEEIGTMGGEIKDLKGELVLIKRALAQGNICVYPFHSSYSF